MKTPRQFRTSGRNTLLTLLALTGLTVATHYKDNFASFNFSLPRITMPSFPGESGDANERGYYLPLRIKDRKESKEDIRNKDRFNAYRTSNGRHGALDLICQVGEPVYPIRDGGVVIEAIDNEHPRTKLWRNGKTVRIQYPERMGVISTYIHLDSYRVRVGDKVNHDDIVGHCGITGNASADNPHLHITIKSSNGKKLYNPEDVLFQ